MIRYFFSLILFVVVQILFIPIAILGILMSIHAQFTISRKLGVSGTALEIASERSIMDRFGLRKDTATVSFVEALSVESTIGGWLILFPSYLRYKISGATFGFPAVSPPGRETITNMVIDRTIAVDELIQKAGRTAMQYVSLGAGFDTRWYGTLTHQQFPCYELDRKNTQLLKMELLQKAKIDTSYVHFVDVDFAGENWAKQLVEAGFDSKKQALFLWEGVTLYLSEESVRNTLRKIKSVACPGSILICDIYAERFIKGKYSGRGKVIKRAAAMTGEGLGFGLDFSANYMEALKIFLSSENLIAGEVKYFGEKTKRGVFMTVVEITL
jgi:methyltransferase (TIGR00027 family)